MDGHKCTLTTVFFCWGHGVDFAASKAAKAAYSAPLGTVGYVSEVDALRCVAMTAFVAVHCRLLPFGWAGVWLFFVISGFAITSSLLASDRMSSDFGSSLGICPVSVRPPPS
jgi:hypothetical protein